MKRSTCLISVFLHLGLLISLTAQSDDIRFERVIGSNGINLGKINSMTRDKHGAMWFSDQTYASIIRYDGNRMVRFSYDRQNENLLGGYYPETLISDSTGAIWIGYYGQGLDRFDPALGSFKHFRHDPEDPESLPNDTITALLIDRANRFWVGTYAGLCLFDPVNGTFKQYAHDPQDPSSLSYNQIRCLYEDRNGVLWVGTGLAWDQNNLGGLNRFDPDSESFTRYVHEPDNPNSLVDNKVRAIFEDSQGRFWVGTRGEGLHLLDRNTGRMTRIAGFDPQSKLPFRTKPSSAEDHITFITEDVLGYLWIGTLSGGVMRYNPVTGKTFVYNAGSNPESGFQDNSAWWIQTSPDGFIWISTQESNLYRVNLNHVEIAHYNFNSSRVNSFSEVSPEKLLLASDAGIRILDEPSGQVHPFHLPTEMHDANLHSAWRAYMDPRGRIGLSSNGLHRFDPATQKVESFTSAATDSTRISSNYVSTVMSDDEGNWWVGTWGNGLNKILDKKRIVRQYVQSDSDSSGISGRTINELLWDPPGHLWVATDEGILNLLDTKTGTIRHYYFDRPIISIFRGSDDVVRVGTWGPMYIYHPASDRFVPYESSNGLSLYSVMEMVEDADQCIWATSRNGIYRLHLPTNDFILFSHTSGINGGSISTDALIYTSAGNILVGTESGYYKFNPDAVKPIPYTPSIVLIGLTIGGVYAKPGPGRILNEPVNMVHTLTLPYHANTFSLEYSFIDFGASDDKIVGYKLEPMDREWVQGDVSTSKIDYYNLPPGRYTLKLKAANLLDGRWAERELAVEITPPWFQSTLAFVGYFFVLLGLGFVGYRFQKQRWLKSERERNKDRELAQAREVEKAYHELKQTQTQLIHAEKMASLGELTAGIAHEIQNPLNFVNNFSELNTELIDELGEELKAGHLDEVHSIAQVIRENENKINYHGKRADSIVKSMLQHSRAQSGQKTQTDINALVDECARLSYHGMRAKDKTFNAKTDFALQPDLPRILVASQDIGRVLLNLFTNAFYAVRQKKRDAGEGYDPVVYAKTQSVPNGIEITVRDNGNGIHQEALDKIFNPFFTTKAAGEGTGLGLSISFDIITKGHNGTLSVNTKEGEFAEFRIFLPFTNEPKP